MFCTQCRTELPEGSQFCSQCGTTQSAPRSAAFTAGRTAGRHPFRTIMPVALGIVGVLIVAAIINQQSPLSTHTASAARPFPQAHEEVIANTAFTVKQLSFGYYKFEVPFNSTNVSVDGHFQASGGLGNDIEVYLLDQDGFVNWQNKHAVTTYYNSGRLTEGTISATLPSLSTMYYLVFNNKFSLISPKAVQLSATLRYTN